VLDHVEIGEGISLVHWTADERVIGKTLAQAELRSRWGLNLVAVKRARPDGEESVSVMPDADFSLVSGDVLLLVGAEARIRAFTRGSRRA
jgi:trk system potassium uptake protein TrkA